MKEIIPPITPNSTGKEVANLQECLLFLLDKNIFITYKLTKKPTEKELLQLRKMLIKEKAASLFGESTQQLVHYFQMQQGLGVGLKGVMEKLTASKLNVLLKELGALDADEIKFIVNGFISKATGEGCPNILVNAFDCDMRRAEPLGETTTDEKGYYEIKYSLENFTNAEKNNADIKIIAQDIKNQLHKESEIYFNANTVQEINLTMPELPVEKGKSEWEILNDQILPLLKGQKRKPEIYTHLVNTAYDDLPPSELTHQDIEFIVSETKLDRLAISAWVSSNQMQNEAVQKLNVEHPEEMSILSEYGWLFFYALARQNITYNLEAVLNQSAENWNQAIRSAIFLNRIPEIDDKIIARLVKAIELIQRLKLLDPNQTSDSPFARILSSLNVPISRNLALNALTIVQEKGMNNPDAVLELVKQYPDEERGVNLLVRSLRVNQLVDGHTALFQNLNARFDGDSHSIEPLAAIPISEWVDIAAQTELSQAVVLQVQINVEKQHPLIAFESKLEGGHIQLDDNLSNNIKTFINDDKVNAEAILKGQTKIITDTGESDSHIFLKNLGRFVRTGMNMELTGLLMNIGIDTPAIANRYGRDFIKDQIREKFPKTDTDEVIDGFIHTSEDYIRGGLEISIGGASMNTIPVGYYGVDEPLPQGERENLPSLPGLFGDLDECMCKPCESMLGQPAYLVDLLNLLKKVTTIDKVTTTTGLDLLNRKRSNIADLKLSCENAEQEIQHIDIVLEILEKAAGVNPYQQQLLAAIYPWQFPFDLHRTEIKANLEKLNISLSEWMLLESPDPSGDKLLAAEILDLSFPQTNNPNNFISEWQLITTKRSSSELWNAFGLYPDSNNHVNLIDPASSEKLINLPIQDVLLRISVLLDRTNLDLDSFEEMIATKFIGALSISNRNQCKTSAMRLNISNYTLEDCLDRIHRFVRLHNKLSDWSFNELDHAISACQFSETSTSTSGNREALLIKLATIKRLSDQYGLPIDILVKVPDSIPELCRLMGITQQQLTLLKTITGLDLTSTPFKWDAFEKFCNANTRFAETGLTIEQVGEALLTRAQLTSLNYSFNESFKSDEAITDFLEQVQTHINTVAVLNSTIDLKTQVSDQLTAILGEADAGIIVKAITDAGAEIPILPTDEVKKHIKNILHNKPATKNVSESFPLLPDSLVEELVGVKSSDNPTTELRFSQFILSRLREKALIEIISELSSLSQPEVTVLLKEKLLLDDIAGQENIAYHFFINESFLIRNEAQCISRLSSWVDRLFRLKTLKANLGLENELLHLTERIFIDNQPGIKWRDTLASIGGATGNRWPDKNWQAIEDIIWLQQPDKLSRTVLLELFNNLEKRGNSVITIADLQPLALRLNLPVQQILDFSQGTIINGIRAQWIDATQLRKAFTHLMSFRIENLGIAPNQLTDIQDNASVSVVTNVLVKLRFGESEWEAVKQITNNVLRPQKRNALIALLIQKSQPRNANELDEHYIKNANDLYEQYLIDPLMEPCMITTRVLEAITATQLFSQRILFGLEPGIKSCTELKQQWTWMRNYRVWEANRKVFLFPENWLYPELRDDKSSSFKQLESALGQGELNEELADEVFGQFLDDVAQMGQVEVLGMYEDLKYNNTRRDLYVVGRSPNPPYIYYWRKCIDFGTIYMEWLPWQRIELDIQGDHVMPFVLGGQLHIAWPLIKFNHQDAPKSNEWEVKLAWSKYDGKTWRKASISREASLLPEVAFSDEIRGFSFRCRISEDGKKSTVLGYFVKDRPEAITDKPQTSSGPPQTYLIDDSIFKPNFVSTPTTTSLEKISRLAELVFKSYDNLPNSSIAANKVDIIQPLELKKHLELFTMKKTFHSPYYDGLDIFSEPAIAFNGHLDSVKTFNLTRPTDAQIKPYINAFIAEFRRASGTNADKSFDRMYQQVADLCSVRNLSCRAWIKLSTSTGKPGLRLIDGNNGRFNCQIGQENYNLTPERNSIPIFRLGDQPALSNISLTIDLNGVSLTSEVENLPEISSGKLRNQTLNFLFDSNKITQTDQRNKFISDLNINLNAERTLQLTSKFELTNNDNLAIQKGDNSELSSNVIGSSLPWMNGYLEILTSGNQYAANPIAISGTPVLSSSPSGQFWIVGAVASAINSSKIWHFSDSGLRGYVNLQAAVSNSKSELSVYADSYKDAVQFRVDWYQSKYLSQSDLVAGSFSTKELFPLLVDNDTKLWIKTHNKDLALSESLPYRSDLTFDNQLPYSCYNWEIFFHAPLMVADQLSKQHKFEDAEKWLRYIFDPTSGEPGTDAKRFLKFRVFREMDLNNQVINDLKVLAQVASGLATNTDIMAVQKLIQRWRELPFRPFIIARGRQIAFLWRTMFAYMDNLLAWADSLYRQDTRESINEAVMIYVLAQKILGRRPQVHKGKSKKDAFSYNQKMGDWDDFANYWIDLGGRGNDRIYHGGKISTEKYPSSEGMLYFCMPFNDKMLNYWNSVDDRLFNIRHCRNIEGIERNLPFTESPIDPELLIRAVNDGLNLGDVINGLYAPPPQYRYNILAGRAADLSNETKALGAAMLSAIEKRDAENLSLLRSTNEISLLKLVSEVKTLQITEAERNIDALNSSRKSVSTRYYQYQRLLGKKDIKVPGENESAGEESMLGSVDSGMASNRSGLGLIKEENEQYVGFEGANTWSIAANISKIAGGVFHASSSVVAAIPTDKVTNASKVLEALGSSSSVLGDAFSMVSQGWKSYAEQQGMIAGHLRRRDEWAFQSNQTLKELQQIDKQILANKIRIEITRKELSNHIEQMEQSKAVDEVMRSKFSNEQLYQWMVAQLSGLYFNAYRMCLEMARSAERAAARELGVKPLNILRNNYWDSLHMGLLAGDRLHQDLKRLEIAYLDQNRREYEMTKHISLRRLDPLALVNLRITDNGNCRCEFEIPEWLFDLDTPGHYLRRIKSVSVSIPCIVGPYTSVNCKLTLLSSHIRHERAISSGYRRKETGDDLRFTDYFGASETIVTSNANGDSGLFETQLRDERFLPFEGSGVISRWRLELPGEFKQFDYSTISDVILSVRYTARDGGDQLRVEASKSVENFIKSATPKSEREGLFALIDLKHDLPNEWHQLKANGSSELIIGKSRLPYIVSSIDTSSVESVIFMAKITNNPVEFTINVNHVATPLAFENKVKLYKGINSDIRFDTLFTISVSATDKVKLEEFLMILKYKF